MDRNGLQERIRRIKNSQADRTMKNGIAFLKQQGGPVPDFEMIPPPHNTPVIKSYFEINLGEDKYH